eukprot:sb/3475201/
MIYDTPPDTKMLVVATTSETESLVSPLTELFEEVVDIPAPSDNCIRQFFRPLLTTELDRNFSVTTTNGDVLEELVEAPPVKPKPLSNEELASIEKREVLFNIDLLIDLVVPGETLHQPPRYKSSEGNHR